jgi:hypothetical protein
MGGRLNICCRALAPDMTLAKGQPGTVKILKSGESNFHYGGLMVCGSVWVCPICASKITERRRVELAQGVENWLSGGHGVSLLTLTVPHYAKNSLQTVLDGLTDAFRRMMKGKPWKRVSEQIVLVGRVRTLEVTHGPNGWHPHFHILLFTESPLDSVDLLHLADALLIQWQSSALAAGLPKPNHHGLTLQDGSEAARYVSKWGIDHEMTKGHLKQGVKAGHVSPFGLLEIAADQEPGYEKVVPLFREYGKAFKGKRQLVWSDGLRGLLGLGQELTDEEIATSEEEKATLFFKIPLNVWKIVLQKERRGELLNVCENGLDALHDYLIELMDVYIPEEFAQDEAPF